MSISKLHTGLGTGMWWTRVRDGELRVKKFKKFKEGDQSVWGKAYATIHASAPQVLAFLWNYCSNLRMIEHFKKDGHLLREVYVPPPGSPISPSKNSSPQQQHRTQFIVVQKSMPPPFKTRESNIRVVWDEFNNYNDLNHNNDKNSPSLIMAFEPAEVKHPVSVGAGRVRKTNDDYSIIRKSITKNFKRRSSKISLGRERSDSVAVQPVDHVGVVQLQSKGVWVIKPLAQNLCDVTFVTNIIDEGKIPTSVVNSQIIRNLSLITFLKTFYERNGLEADAEVSERSEAKRTSHVEDVSRQKKYKKY